MNMAGRMSFGAKVMRFLKDPQVALWRKMGGFVAALYVILPFDVIPDVIPFVGWLDDLGVMALAVGWMLRQIQRHSQAQDERGR